MTIQCLAERGQSRRRIAGILGVSEGAVRYHLRRAAGGATGGRCRQAFLAETCAEAIAAYLEAVDEVSVNLAALHEWLQAEHDYPGSLRSVQRYFRRRYPKPARRGHEGSHPSGLARELRGVRGSEGVAPDEPGRDQRGQVHGEASDARDGP